VDTSLIVPLITGSGVAGVFCVLFVLGWVFPRRVVEDKDAQIMELKADRDAQRERADIAVAGLTASKDVIAALQAGLSLAQRSPPALAPPAESGPG
jgi:hypothetical protein